MDTATKDQCQIPYSNKKAMLLIGVAFLLSFWMFNPNLEYGGDDATYIITAVSMAEGQGPHLLNDPKNRLATHFPVGYPFLLSLIARVSKSIIFFKIPTVIFFVLSLFIFYKGFHRIFGASAFVSAGFYATSYNVLILSHQVMPETFYFMFSLLALLATLRYEKEKSTHWSLVVSALFIACTIKIRSIGLAVLLASIAWLWLQKKKTKAAALLIAAVFFLFAFNLAAWGAIRRISGEYGFFSLIASERTWPTIKEQSLNYFYYLPRIFWDVLYMVLHYVKAANPLWGKAIQLFLSLGFCAVIFGGMIKLSLKKEARLIIFYIILYTAVLLVWPFCEFGRFMLPVSLFIIAIFMAQLKDWAESNGTSLLKRSVYFGIVCILILSNLSEVFRSSVYKNKNIFSFWPQRGSSRSYDASLKNYLDAGSWIARNASEDALVASRKPAVIYLWTGRKGIFWEDIQFSDYLKSGRKIYFLIEQNDPQFDAIDRKLQLTAHLKEVFRTGEEFPSAVYEWYPPSGSQPAASEFRL